LASDDGEGVATVASTGGSAGAATVGTPIAAVLGAFSTCGRVADDGACAAGGGGIDPLPLASEDWREPALGAAAAVASSLPPAVREPGAEDSLSTGGDAVGAWPGLFGGVEATGGSRTCGGGGAFEGGPASTAGTAFAALVALGAAALSGGEASTVGGPVTDESGVGPTLGGLSGGVGAFGAGEPLTVEPGSSGAAAGTGWLGGAGRDGAGVGLACAGDGGGEVSVGPSLSTGWEGSEGAEGGAWVVSVVGTVAEEVPAAAEGVTAGLGLACPGDGAGEAAAAAWPPAG
jgi:hypothetical protein